LKKIKKSLFFDVFLGGKANKANIELHDFRWVICSKIEDTFYALRKDWFGYMRIDQMD
tara:strand:- start:196 stop:369 length:174 start_codon:yes stop_codon:yes gene_type:complete